MPNKNYDAGRLSHEMSQMLAILGKLQKEDVYVREPSAPYRPSLARAEQA